MIDIEKLKWQAYTSEVKIPKQVISWVIEDTSLTAKLKQKYADFRVNLIKQTEKEPKDFEKKLLELQNETTIIREVELIGNNCPVVFARSIIPKTKDTAKILAIGAKPLGEILFNDKKIQRGDLEISKNLSLFARRSIFKIKDTKILVMEIFLEKLYA